MYFVRNALKLGPEAWRKEPEDAGQGHRVYYASFPENYL